MQYGTVRCVTVRCSGSCQIRCSTYSRVGGSTVPAQVGSVGKIGTEFIGAVRCQQQGRGIRRQIGTEACQQGRRRIGTTVIGFVGISARGLSGAVRCELR